MLVHLLEIELKKKQLGCRFDIIDNESYFSVFWHMKLYISWYIRSFFGFTFLNILYFVKYFCTNIFHRRSLYTFYVGELMTRLEQGPLSPSSFSDFYLWIALSIIIPSSWNSASESPCVTFHCNVSLIPNQMAHSYKEFHIFCQNV